MSHCYKISYLSLLWMLRKVGNKESSSHLSKREAVVMTDESPNFSVLFPTSSTTS